MRCTKGAIFDVIVDMREGSATRGQVVRHRN
jgi:dTDP-4-dehydrorhamnose 3,5-epimerase-like enzyme